MLLTITTTHRPATDLGYLLHKNPARAQSIALGFGTAHLFYPEASPERCTAALHVEVDPVALVRERRRGPEPLEQYVNDRPYAASSFLAVALGQAFGTALGGRSKERQALAETEIPLEARVVCAPCRGGVRIAERLFAPLGYEVQSDDLPLDERFPEWGASAYRTLRITGQRRIADLLAHLYVLMPVLDDDKHYWVGDAEVEKLLRRGSGWLSGHPEKELISSRYLKHRRALTERALARLLADEAPTDPDEEQLVHDRQEAEVEAPIRLDERRRDAVLAQLERLGARTVVDLGCGEGKLVNAALASAFVTRMIGMDVSQRALERANERLARLPPARRARCELLHGSLFYRDRRLEGLDAATAVEVVEHLELDRVPAFTRNLLGCIRPRVAIVTTPNREFNATFAGVPAGRLRHLDHRFEWTRAECRAWAEAAASEYGYAVTIHPIGDEDPVLGAPTQMVVFTRAEGVP